MRACENRYALFLLEYAHHLLASQDRRIYFDISFSHFKQIALALDYWLHRAEEYRASRHHFSLRCHMHSSNGH